MNKKTVFSLIILTIGILIMNSCAARGEKVEKLPGIDIPMTEYNTKVELVAYPGMPTSLTSGDAFVLLILNRSANTIVFAQDFGVKIFKKQKNVWEPIKNKWDYPEGETFLPTNKDYPSGLDLSVFPDVGDLKSSTTIRVVVIGHMKSRPDNQVAAYIDIQYDPNNLAFR